MYSNNISSTIFLYKRINRNSTEPITIAQHPPSSKRHFLIKKIFSYDCKSPTNRRPTNLRLHLIQYNVHFIFRKKLSASFSAVVVDRRSINGRRNAFTIDGLETKGGCFR